MSCCACQSDVELGTEEAVASRNCAWRGVVALIVCGVLVLALLVVVPLSASPILASLIARSVVVDSAASPNYALWVSNEGDGAPPESFSVYVFNVTNSAEVIAGKTPRLAQIGPFVYRSIWKRHAPPTFDVNFSADARSVQYFTYNRFELDLEASVADPSSTWIISLNVPALGLRAQLGSDTWPGALLSDVLLDAYNASDAVFSALTVEALVWGYDSPLLSWLNTALGLNASVQVPPLQHNSTSEAADRLFFGERDAFGTGLGDVDELNRAQRWGRWSTLPWWGAGDAQTIRGTDGHGFAPPVTPQSQLAVFADEAFRHVQLAYTRATQVHGIDTLRFGTDANDFLNTCSTANPTCAPYWLNAPDGLTNLTSALFATTGVPLPIFLSQPRFSASDRWYRSDANVHFLAPHDGDSADELQTFLDIEPTTGVVLNASKRLQLVAQVAPSLFIAPQLHPCFLPIAWFELSSAATPDLASQLSAQLALPKRAMLSLLIVAPSVAALLFLSAVILWRFKVRDMKTFHVQSIEEEYAALLSKD